VGENSLEVEEATVATDMGHGYGSHKEFEARESLKNHLFENYKPTNYPDHVYTSVSMNVLRLYLVNMCSI